MGNHYQNMAAAIAASENVVTGPWPRKAPVKNPRVRPRDLPAGVVRFNPPADDEGEPLPVVSAQFMLPAAIFCALMDAGVENPAIRTIYDSAVERMRKLAEHPDERVRTQAACAWLAAFSRPYL